jgi:hypothetical protein
VKRLLVALVLVLVGCPGAEIRDEEIKGLPFVTADGVIVRYRDSEVEKAVAVRVAAELSRVRIAVAEEYALVLSSSTEMPPLADVVLHKDRLWGQERWLVTHALILEPPLRVRIQCAFPPEDDDGSKIADRIRGTVAHEIAEATFLTRVPIIEPYLRWVHDGFAESVAFRVLARVQPRAALEMLERYGDYEAEERKPPNQTAWVDLTRWRQLPDWIIHSDAFMKGVPIRLGDPREFERILAKRIRIDDPDPVIRARALAELSMSDALLGLLGESWTREHMGFAAGEARVEPKNTGAQFLCYAASCCLWLELERAHPGVTAKTLAAVSARREPILRTDDIVAIVKELTGEDIRPRLERFSLDRLEAVLASEKQRLK